MHAADLLSKRAELTPDREALVELPSGRRFTYAGLNRRANRLANLMQRLGVRPGDRVSILAHNSVFYLDLLYGLPKIGAVFAPLNWRLTARELAYIVRDCSPKVILCGPEFAGTLAEIKTLLAQDAGYAAASQPGTALEVVFALEGASIHDALLYEPELERASPAEPERPPLEADSPYCIMYTSGTTGHPKGAVLPHRQVLWNCINTVISWGLSEKDISPVLTPLFHTGGLFVFLTPLLYAGGKIILIRSFDPDESLRVIQQEGCTVVLGVPTLFQMWMKSPEYPAADFRKVHFFINGGAACPPAVMEAWRREKNVVFRQGYGLTEVGTNCFSMTDEESNLKAGSVGKPIFHSQMRLVDPESGQDVPRGEPGELLIRGPHVCLGYWKNPEATAEALRGGWFHTGDMAHQDEDGFYFIVGRYKDMIKSGGENIYAAEVESVFREHPAVADVALIGQPDEKWGEVGLMIVALKPGCRAEEEELLELCRGRLARFKIPRRILFTDSLPYSPYGKVEKAKLRAQYLPAE